MWGNCWTYALSRWWRAGWRDSYLVVRMTRRTWLPIPHVFWARDIEGLAVSEFQPSGWWVRKFRGPVGRAIFPLLSIWFHGRIRTARGEETKEERAVAEANS